MIPLYILGLLLRFGPQHGYQLKKRMEEQLQDFTQIKLPTLYYHLEKMVSAGFITASRDKQGARPEKTVYRVSNLGEAEFRALLRQTLDFSYRPSFEGDAAFYFADGLPNGELARKLAQYIARLQQTLDYIEPHRDETLEQIPKDFTKYAAIIFEHHLLHYRAELAWAKDALNQIGEDDSHDQTQSH